MNDLLILANLLPGPLHGYALKKQIGLVTGQGQMHNNLIYPLLRRFERNKWISSREVAGERGQTREVYELTKKGKQELLRRLSQFTGKEAASENAFRLRVGLFDILDAETRRGILAVRDEWLAARQERVARLTGALNAGPWGSEVLSMLGQQIRAERKWISRLKRKA